MELHDLKNVWDKENIDATPEISVEKQKELHLPLEKMRKSMWKEFIITTILLVLLVPVLLIFNSNPFLKWSVYLLMLLVTAYYLFTFHRFYEKIKLSTFDTYHQLMELKYDLRLNAELYKSYYVALMPIFMSIIFLILQEIDFFKVATIYMKWSIFTVIFFTMGNILYFGRLEFKKVYGKYIDQVDTTIKDLL